MPGLDVSQIVADLNKIADALEALGFPRWGPWPQFIFATRLGSSTLKIKAVWCPDMIRLRAGTLAKSARLFGDGRLQRNQEIYTALKSKPLQRPRPGRFSKKTAELLGEDGAESHRNYCALFGEKPWL